MGCVRQRYGTVCRSIPRISRWYQQDSGTTPRTACTCREAECSARTQRSPQSAGNIPTAGLASVHGTLCGFGGRWLHQAHHAPFFPLPFSVFLRLICPFSIVNCSSSNIHPLRWCWVSMRSAVSMSKDRVPASHLNLTVVTLAAMITGQLVG